jgi:hypothetical protein
MSFEPNPKQSLLIWRMLFEPDMGEVDADVAKKDIRAPLEAAGLLEAFEVVSPTTNRKKRRYRLTDKAWSWSSAHLDAKLNRAPSAGPLLQAVLTRVKRVLESKDLSLAEFASIGDEQGSNRRSNGNSAGAGAGTVRERARAAYLACSHGRWNEAVRLDALRAALPDVPREALDEALVNLLSSGEGVLYPEDNLRKLTPAVEQAAVSMAGEKKHYLKLER